MSLTKDKMDGAEADILAAILKRMPEDTRARTELMSRLKNEYVECGRDRLLREKFDRFLEDVLGSMDGVRNPGNTFYVTGESGAGKTMGVDRLLSSHPILQPMDTALGQYRPYVRTSLQGAATLRMLGQCILEATGYISEKEMKESEIWNFLPKRLRECRVLLVHIDEMQHALKRSKTDQQNVADALKALMNQKGWPVSFVLSGLPKTTELSRLDEQVGRRQFMINFPPVKLPLERKLVEKIITKMSGVAKVDCADILTTDVPERAAHAANYQYGRISAVTAAALRMAVLASEKTLTRHHFSDAYKDHSEATGRKDVNPFLATNWKNLEPGLFIVDRANETI